MKDETDELADQMETARAPKHHTLKLELDYDSDFRDDIKHLVMERIMEEHFANFTTDALKTMKFRRMEMEPSGTEVTVEIPEHWLDK